MIFNPMFSYGAYASEASSLMLDIAAVAKAKCPFTILSSLVLLGFSVFPAFRYLSLLRGLSQLSTLFQVQDVQMTVLRTSLFYI
jgi:hypothetical protein